MLEHLKKVQTEQAAVRERDTEILSRLSHSKTGIARIVRDNPCRRKAESEGRGRVSATHALRRHSAMTQKLVMARIHRTARPFTPRRWSGV
jgi:hypothetical protein